MKVGDLDVSIFRPVSTGQVLENPAVGSKVISVNMTEHSPMADGELKESVESYDSDGVDDDGNAYKTSVTTSTGITATWLPLQQANRQTAPNVRRGERVQLWQSGDDDKYYWTDLGLDFNLRRGETVVFAFSNFFENTDQDSLSLDNCYFFEVSTHLGSMTLGTSRSNGEPFAYSVQINAKEGAVIIQDDQNNHILMDSTNRLIRAHNSDGTYVELDKKVMNFYAPDAINAKADNAINFVTKLFTLKSANANITAETAIDGNCSVSKKLTAKSISAGGLSCSGNIDVDGVVNAKAFNKT